MPSSFGTGIRKGEIIVLPNAFDVATARLIARHRPIAIGTTSAAIAAVAGYADGEQIQAGEMLEAIGRITRAVDVGVTADIEAAYGDEVDDAAIMVERLIEIGLSVSTSKTQATLAVEGRAGCYRSSAPSPRSRPCARPRMRQECHS